VLGRFAQKETKGTKESFESSFPSFPSVDFRVHFTDGRRFVFVCYEYFAVTFPSAVVWRPSLRVWSYRPEIFGGWTLDCRTKRRSEPG